MRRRFNKRLSPAKQLNDGTRRRMARNAIKKRLVQRRLKQIPMCLDGQTNLSDD